MKSNLVTIKFQTRPYQIFCLKLEVERAQDFWPQLSLSFDNQAWIELNPLHIYYEDFAIAITSGFSSLAKFLAVHKKALLSLCSNKGSGSAEPWAHLG